MSKPTHAFVPCQEIRRCELCHDMSLGGQCALPRSAHPASLPEHAPESPEDRVRAKVESIGRDEARRRIEAFCAEPDPAPEPEPLRRLAEEWILRRAGLTWHQEALSLTRLLERAIRETAQLAGEGGAAGALQRWGLDPESKEER